MRPGSNYCIYEVFLKSMQQGLRAQMFTEDKEDFSTGNPYALLLYPTCSYSTKSFPTISTQTACTTEGASLSLYTDIWWV